MLAGKPKGMRYFLSPQRRSPQSQPHARLVQLFKCETRKAGREIISQGSATPCHCSLFGGNMTHSPSRVQDGPVPQPAAHLWAPPGPGLKAKLFSSHSKCLYHMQVPGLGGEHSGFHERRKQRTFRDGDGESCLVQPQPHLLKTGRCPSYTPGADT